MINGHIHYKYMQPVPNISFKKMKNITYLAALISILGTLIYIGASWGTNQNKIAVLQKDIGKIERNSATSKDIRRLETLIQGYGDTTNYRFDSIDKRLNRIESQLDKIR